MDLNDWPDCGIEGCENKCCLALDSDFCFPHTPGNTHVKHIIIDAKHHAKIFRTFQRQLKNVSP